MTKTDKQTATIMTKWQVWTYDVWGNAKDGYEVNASWRNGEVDIMADVKTWNTGTAGEFQSVELSHKQIRQAFGLTNIRIKIDGDDLTYYVNRKRDGYPIGEMQCVSHRSLSPIKEAE
jgi:hypothetical protein